MARLPWFYSIRFHSMAASYRASVRSYLGLKIGMFNTRGGLVCRPSVGQADVVGAGPEQPLKARRKQRAGWSGTKKRSRPTWRIASRPSPLLQTRYHLGSALGLPSGFVKKRLWLRSGDVRELGSASHPQIHCGGGDFPAPAGGLCGERRLAHCRRGVWLFGSAARRGIRDSEVVTPCERNRGGV